MKKILCALVLFILTIGLVGCGDATNQTTNTSKTPLAETPPPVASVDGYLREDGTGIHWLQWTANSNGKITGQWNTATLDATTNKPVYQHGTLTGKQDGDKISLTMTSGDKPITSTGMLTGTIFDLQTPGDGGTIKDDEYTGTSTATYNQALTAFKTQHPTV